MGALVFVHELGHFLVAKATGVRVLTFSLGFGPRIFGFTRGETDYRISIIPLGGYVRMYGDDPGEDVPEEERARSYLHKPVLQKSAIAFAGPFANFLLPVALFFGLMVGSEEIPTSLVGTVVGGEPAANGGMQPGDRIMSIDAEPVTTFAEVQERIENSPGQALAVVVQRDGETRSLSITPKAETPVDPLAGSKKVGRVGIMPGSRRPFVNVAPGSEAAKQGLQSGDAVESVNGTPVSSWRTLKKALREAGKGPVTLEIRRHLLSPPQVEPVGDKGAARNGKLPPAEIRTIVIPGAATADDEAPVGAKSALPALYPYEAEFARSGVTRDDLAEPALQKTMQATQRLLAAEIEAMQDRRGISSYDGTLQAVSLDTVAARLGLQGGDRVVALDGKPLHLGASLNLKLFAAPDDIHVLGVLSKDTEHPAGTSRLHVFRMEGVKKHGQEDFKILGAYPAGALYNAGELVTQQVGPMEALTRAVSRTADLIVATARSLLMLFTGKVGFSSLGGPLTIVSYAGQAAEQGLSRYIELMAFISVNLGIVNLLPIPVLDGGHLLMFGIEGITRRRLDLKTRERAMKVGLGFLLVLIVGALVNDFLRLL